MRNRSILLTAFVTGFSGAIMPGPMLALVIGAVGAQGFGALPPILAGHALLEVATLLLLLAGLSALLERPRVRGAIGIVGGLALLWMGAGMLRSVGAVSADLAQAPVVEAWWLLLSKGAAVCAANPYFIGWWATIGSGQVAHLALRRRSDFLTFYIGHEMSDVVWYCIVGLLVSAGLRALSPGFYQGLVAVCALSLLALAVIFVRAGVVLIRSR